MSVSARNQLHGTVSAIYPGSVNDEIEIFLDKGAVNATFHILTDEGSNLTAVITNESMAEMDISEGKRVIALIKASSVLLAVKQPDSV